MRSRKDIQTQEGLVTLLCAERRRVFGVGVAGGKGPQRRGPEDGDTCRLQAGGSLPPSGSGLGLMSLGVCCGMRRNASYVRFGTPRLVKAEESAENFL
jgi:hypothetical protein